jgi:hypothetical protein
VFKKPVFLHFMVIFPFSGEKQVGLLLIKMIFWQRPYHYLFRLLRGRAWTWREVNEPHSGPVTTALPAVQFFPKFYPQGAPLVGDVRVLWGPAPEDFFAAFEEQGLPEGMQQRIQSALGTAGKVI